MKPAQEMKNEKCRMQKFRWANADIYATRIPTPRPAPISGLLASQSYHYHIVANNSAGITNSPDATFFTGTQ